MDLQQGVLRIRGTKFRKTRLVPLHPTTVEALRKYVRARDKAYPRSTSPAFFLSQRAGRLSQSGFEDAFRQARAKAGLEQDFPRKLRPHDLRHRFATTRLITWYREGQDVQARLPLLATYLGHTRYSDTAYYLTGSADLLAIAAERAPTMATTIQMSCRAVGNPPAANIAPHNANGSAKMECSHLIISRVTRRLRRRGTGRL